MSNSARVEDLQEKDASIGVHCVEDLLPSFHLLSIIEAGGPWEAVSSWAPRGSLSEDESCSSPLGIVFGDQLSGDIVVDIASYTSECSHEYSILESKRAQGNGVTPIFLH